MAVLTSAPSKATPISSAFTIGAFFLFLTTGTYFITALAQFAGICVGAWIYPLAAVISGITVWLVDPRKQSLLALTIAILIIAFITIVCIFIEDASYDGNFYHQRSMALWLQGWNPYHPTPSWDANYDIWAWHYAKALEMTGASMASLIGYIEAGKTVNFLIILSATFLSYDFAGRLLPSLSNKQKIWIALLVGCNPIGIGQALTYYNDFAKYYYLVITLICVVSLSRSEGKMRHLWSVSLFLIVIMAIGTKFTAFFEEGVALMACMIWYAFKRQWRVFNTLLLVGILGLVVGALVLGYHPYVTNTLTAGHPLYPLMGEGAEDIMTGLTPPQVLHQNRLYGFFYSLFTPKIPSYASFLGGFGFAMPLLLAAAIIVGVRGRKNISAPFYYAGAWVLASCMFYEQAWWARYICQLWLLVPTSALASFYIGGKVMRWLRGIIIIFAALNTAGIAARCVAYTSTLSLRRAMLYEFTGKNGVARIANSTPECRRHFEERGIRVEEIPQDSLSPFSLVFYAEFCPGIYPYVDVDSCDYARFAEVSLKVGMNPELHRSCNFTCLQ